MFYRDLIGMAQQRAHTLDLPSFYHAAQDLHELDSPITENEVWDVVKNLPPDKAPSPDGFTGRFYKSCWGSIKDDVMAAIGAVHSGDSRALQALDSALLVLIPKQEEAINIGDYRPISLIHSFAKLVTKILANRLAPKLQTMVATNQSTFIRGRSIHDNFSLVQHMARYLHNRKEPRLLVKLDITKAFDSVSWSFLLELLHHLGFGDRWCNLICNLLSTSTTRILLNGQPGDTLHHRRGLRQGEPLSLMLFIMVMDMLTALVAKADSLNLLKPLATRNMGHQILLYASDISLLHGILRIFGEATGLQVNLAKSSFIPIRCTEEQAAKARCHMPCALGSFPCKYLGLPLSVRKLTKADLQPYIDRIADMLPTWKASLLAKSGRLVLVRAVLTVLPIYMLIAVMVPKWMIQAIDKIIRAFLWRGRRDLRGGHCPVA